MLLAALFVTSNIASAQLWGEFVILNDGHCYFTATNNFNTSGVIKVTTVSYYNSVSTNTTVFISGYGDGFVIGPSNWYWHRGDRVFVTYPDGTNACWECPYTDYIYDYSYNIINEFEGEPNYYLAEIKRKNENKS